MPDPINFVRNAARAVDRLLDGDVTGAVRQLLGLALDLMPADQLRAHLTDVDIARANQVADAAELAKFGRIPLPFIGDTEPPSEPER